MYGSVSKFERDGHYKEKKDYNKQEIKKKIENSQDKRLKKYIQIFPPSLNKAELKNLDLEGDNHQKNYELYKN